MAALGKAGLVNSFLRSDGPYKPKLYYKITDKYLDLGFPKRQYELLAQGLIKNIIENKGEKPAASLLRKVGGKFGQDMMRTLSTQHRINRWNLKLFEEYVVPEIGKFVGVPVEFTKRRNGSLMLKVSNCVFYEISKVHPDIICEGHKAFHQALANHIGKYNAQLEGCIAKGEKTCTTILKKR